MAWPAGRHLPGTRPAAARPAAARLAAAQPERLEEPHWVFVRNAKVQMAAQAMFTISFSYADCLRDGWKPLLDYVSKLHKIQALPAALLEKDDLVDLQGRPLLSSTHVAIKMLHSASTRGGKGRSFLSYLWGGGAEEEEDTGDPFCNRFGALSMEDYFDQESDSDSGCSVSLLSWRGSLSLSWQSGIEAITSLN